MWWVDRPGTQSTFRPKPGTNQECTTSYELVINVKLTCAGKTSVRLVRNSLRANVTGTNSDLCLLILEAIL